jgi:hypothetical protein
VKAIDAKSELVCVMVIVPPELQLVPETLHQAEEILSSEASEASLKRTFQLAG